MSAGETEYDVVTTSTDLSGGDFDDQRWSNDTDDKRISCGDDRGFVEARFEGTGIDIDGVRVRRWIRRIGVDSW